jgi:1,5-anhydro-D-fructose reductase (1,5-anhydro-D-mannitol-forming)
MRVVRWGMIGAGDVTEHKSGPAFQKADRSELVAVMRRTPGKAAEYARRHRVPHHYEVALDLIRDPMVDAIYIASPPGSHAQLALLAAEAGKPTYVEKPMARNFHECKAMNDTFAARGIPLFVAYYRRALPRFLSIKAILDENGIGAITAIVYRYACEPWNGQPLPWRLRAEESGGGLFLDVGCHVLDLLDFLFGPLASVSGSAVNRASRYDAEDHVSMQFETPSCATCNATWDFAGGSQEDSLQIFGTEGSLRTPPAARSTRWSGPIHRMSSNRSSSRSSTSFVEWGRARAPANPRHEHPASWTRCSRNITADEQTVSGIASSPGPADAKAYAPQALIHCNELFVVIKQVPHHREESYREFPAVAPARECPASLCCNPSAPSPMTS